MSSINLSKTTVNLSKGDRINLSKSSDKLNKVMVGLGWDPVDNNYTETQTVVRPGFIGRLLGKQERVVTKRTCTSAAQIDCDAWLAFIENGKCNDNDNILYYGHKDMSYKGQVIAHHHGDNLTGDGDGDDEEIDIYLDNVPDKYDEIIVGVTIYSARNRHQSFGQIQNTFVRVVDTNDNFEMCHFNQAEMAGNKDATTFIAGKFYKENREWQFKAIGECTMDENIATAAYNSNKY